MHLGSSIAYPEPPRALTALAADTLQRSGQTHYQHAPHVGLATINLAQARLRVQTLAQLERTAREEPLPAPTVLLAAILRMGECLHVYLAPKASTRKRANRRAMPARRIGRLWWAEVAQWRTVI